MWLETELLTLPDTPGFFCISTSYRNEPNPIPGRHETIFPMFEFESKGSMSDLIQLEFDLLGHLGLDKPVRLYYDSVCKDYSVSLLESSHEGAMCEEYGSSISLEHFTHLTWTPIK